METKSDSTNKPQVREKHPRDYDKDLNPDHMAGQNIGQQSPAADPNVQVAADIKELTRRLQDFTMDELRQIPVLPPGERLQQGKTYLNLNDPKRREVTATGDMTAGDRDLYVAKTDVPPPYYNRLLGMSDPQRTQ